MDKSSALGALAAIANETRLDVFRLLVQTGGEGLPAGEIAARLKVLKNTLSTHLTILVHAGLIRRAREGRVIRYRADYDAMRGLLQYLLHDCCQGETAICAPLADALSCEVRRA